MLKDIGVVILGFSLYILLWFLFIGVQTEYDIFPLSWVGAIAASQYSEEIKILSVRSLWAVNFLLPIILASAPIAIMLNTFVKSKIYGYSLAIGLLSCSVLMVSKLGAIFNPGYVPSWFSYLYACVCFIGVPILWSYILKSLTRSSS